MGQNHSMALSNLGFVYCCGSGKFGQLGLGDFENTPNFTQVMQPKGLLDEESEPLAYVISIFAGGNHSWAIVDQPEFEKNLAEVRKEKE